MEVIMAYLAYKPVSFLEGLRKATVDLIFPPVFQLSALSIKSGRVAERNIITNKRT